MGCMCSSQKTKKSDKHANPATQGDPTVDTGPTPVEREAAIERWLSRIDTDPNLCPISVIPAPRLATTPARRASRHSIVSLSSEAPLPLVPSSYSCDRPPGRDRDFEVASYRSPKPRLAVDVYHHQGGPASLAVSYSPAEPSPIVGCNVSDHEDHPSGQRPRSSSGQTDSCRNSVAANAPSPRPDDKVDQSPRHEYDDGHGSPPRTGAESKGSPKKSAEDSSDDDDDDDDADGRPNKKQIPSVARYESPMKFGEYRFPATGNHSPNNNLDQSPDMSPPTSIQRKGSGVHFLAANDASPPCSFYNSPINSRRGSRCDSPLRGRTSSGKARRSSIVLPSKFIVEIV